MQIVVRRMNLMIMISNSLIRDDYPLFHRQENDRVKVRLNYYFVSCISPCLFVDSSEHDFELIKARSSEAMLQTTLNRLKQQLIEEQSNHERTKQLHMQEVSI